MAATTLSPAEYLASLPDERRKALTTLRTVVRRALPPGFKEVGMYGISYVVPLAVSGPTYNGEPLPVVTLTAQKNHMAAYLLGLYSHPSVKAEFEKRWKASGKRLDMGKSCLRFRALDELALDVLAWGVGQVTPEMLVAAREAESPGRTTRERTGGAPKRGPGTEIRGAAKAPSGSKVSRAAAKTPKAVAKAGAVLGGKARGAAASGSRR